MPLITQEDIIDVYTKLVQRGSGFLLSKLNPSGVERTKSAFDLTALDSSNWWIIPKVKERWNKLITGSEQVDYESYVLNKYLMNRRNLRLLSVGSGVCSHEIKFAQSPVFGEVVCNDLVDDLLQIGSKNANDIGLRNMKFVSGDIHQLNFEDSQFDVVLFHSSLHHFYDISGLIQQKIKPLLRSNGIVIINEYVGPDRLQYPKHQLLAINKALKLIPENLRMRFKTNLIKKKYYGSGYLRMLIADPSECKESSQILPVMRQDFSVLEERPFGGNILMSVLKDIAHNFLKDSQEVNQCLNTLFQFEDEYLKKNPSDFVFAVYANTK